MNRYYSGTRGLDLYDIFPKPRMPSKGTREGKPDVIRPPGENLRPLLGLGDERKLQKRKAFSVKFDTFKNLVLGKNFSITGSIKNKTPTLYRNVKLVIAENSYHYVGYALIPVAKQGERVKFECKMTVKTKSPYAIPHLVRFRFQTGADRKYYSKRIRNVYASYVGGFRQTANHDRNYNILILGPNGSGKTSFIKSVLSLFGNPEEDKLFRKKTGETFQYRKHKIPRTNIVMWDTWSSISKKMGPRIFEHMLKGNIKGKWFSRYTMKKYSDDLEEGKKTAYKRKIDIIIYFITREILNDEKELAYAIKQIKSSPVRPLIVISKADRINENLVRKLYDEYGTLQERCPKDEFFPKMENIVVEVSYKTKTDPSEIYYGLNYTHEETKRNFYKDRNNFIILQKAMALITQ